MTPPEAAALLAAVAANDGRNLTEANAHAWAAALPDVSLADALDFLPVYYRTATRDSRNWIYPGDILIGVRQLHVDRRRLVVKAARELAEAGCDPDDYDIDPTMVGIAAARQASYDYDARYAQPEPAPRKQLEGTPW